MVEILLSKYEITNQRLVTWTSGSYSIGEVLLSARAHSIVVEGDGVAGLPAGFFTQLETSVVPAPGALLLGGLGAALVGVIRRRRMA